MGNLTKFRIKTYVDGNRLFEEIGRMFKIRKKLQTMLLEKKLNIKNSARELWGFCDHMALKALPEIVHKIPSGSPQLYKLNVWGSSLPSFLLSLRLALRSYDEIWK